MKMAGAPAKCSFAGIANITCGSSRGKDEFFSLNKCVVEVKNHLRSCNLSHMKVTEYDVILARAGKFNLSHEEVEKMVVCPAHSHNLRIYWRPRKSCQYPDHKGKKIAPHCKTPINWQMAQEIHKMFVTFVKVGSRKYLKTLAIELGFPSNSTTFQNHSMVKTYFVVTVLFVQ